MSQSNKGISTPETFWKAVRMDGTDFYTGTVRWLPPIGEPLPDDGLIVRHPITRKRTTGNSAYYLSVSAVPTDCTSMRWPCRLARVERTRAAVWQPENHSLPNKWASWRWRVVEELDAKLTLGPASREIIALLDRASRLTSYEKKELAVTRMQASGDIPARNNVVLDAKQAAWDIREAALYAVRKAAWNATKYDAWSKDSLRNATAVEDTTTDAVLALLVRDLISTDHYDLLTRLWRTIIGPIHPDDKEL